METSRGPRWSCEVNAIGDGSNDLLWRSEVDRMDVSGDLFISTKRRTTRGGKHD